MKLSKTTGFLLCCLPLLAAQPSRAQQQEQDPAERASSLPLDVVYCVDNAQGNAQIRYEEIQEFIAANVEAFSKFSSPGNIRVGRINYGLVPAEDGKDYEVIPLNPDLRSVQSPIEPNLDSVPQPEIVDKMLKTATRDFRWRPKAYKVLYLIRGGGRFGSFESGMTALTAKGVLVNSVIAAPSQYLRAARLTDPESAVVKMIQIAQRGHGNLLLLDVAANEKLAQTPENQFENALGGTGTSPRRHWAEVNATFGAQFQDLYARFSQTFVPYGEESSKTKNSGNLAMLLINAQQGALTVPQLQSLSVSAWLLLILQRDNSEWDLADAAEREVLDWGKVDEDALPNDLREMDEAERLTYLRQLYAERKGIYGETLLMEERWRQERERPFESKARVQFGTEGLPEMPIQTPFEGKLPPLTGAW